LIAGAVILYFAMVKAPQWDDPMAVNAAMAACQGHGWQPDELKMLSSEGTGSVGFSQTQKVVLTGKNKDKPKTIHVDLEWRIGSSAWKVTDYSEEPGPDDSRVDRDKPARAGP
jgi:hypothetical protein